MTNAPKAEFCEPRKKRLITAALSNVFVADFQPVHIWSRHYRSINAVSLCHSGLRFRLQVDEFGLQPEDYELSDQDDESEKPPDDESSDDQSEAVSVVSDGDGHGDGERKAKRQRLELKDGRTGGPAAGETDGMEDEEGSAEASAEEGEDEEVQEEDGEEEDAEMEVASLHDNEDEESGAAAAESTGGNNKGPGKGVFESILCCS